MDKLEIEFKLSSTGSYSPWHLELIDKYEVPMICTADIGHFVKVGNDIYNFDYPNDYYDLYEYVCDLEKKNDNGELSDEEVLTLLDIALNKPKRIRRCESLEEFEDYLIKYKNRENERKAAHTTSV